MNSSNHQTSQTLDALAYNIQNNIADSTYLRLLREIHENGNLEGNSRTGVGTKSIFARDIRFRMYDGRMPILTTKKMFLKGGIYELLWFLGNHLNDPKYVKFGRTNAKYLIDNGVYIWVGDLYKKYLNAMIDASHIPTENDRAFIGAWGTEDGKPLSKEEFIEKIKTDESWADNWAECGPIYGAQWREWSTPGNFLKPIDQLKNCVEKLKKNPTDRRLMVSAWNVSDIESNTMILPPCHYGFTFYTRLLTLEERIDLVAKEPNFDPLEFGIGPQVTEEHMHKVCDLWFVPRRALSLKWNQRSVDYILGAPFNIFSYALLLRMVAKEVGMIAEELIGSLENVHYYLNQIDAVNEHLSRTVLHSSPTLWLNPDKSIFNYTYDDIKIIGYESQSKIEAPLSN